MALQVSVARVNRATGRSIPLPEPVAEVLEG